MTTNTIHASTHAVDDARTWLDDNFPEGDVSIDHTADCDSVSYGDQCIGGCLVVNA
jgi:hypothetical protein